MKIDWDNISERERWMLIGCGVFLIIYLLYMLVYSPIQSGLAEKENQIQSKHHLLQWMRDAKAQYQMVSQIKPLNASQMLTVLTAQLKQTSFKQFPYQLQQTNAGDIQLSFDEVPYNAWISWLWKMHERYAIDLKQLNIERTSVPGVVKASVSMGQAR